MSSRSQRPQRRSRAGRIGLLVAVIAGAITALICAACGSSGSLTAAVTEPYGDPLTVVNPTDSAGRSISTAGAPGTATTTAPVITTTVSTPRGLKASAIAGGDAKVDPTSTKQSFIGLATELGTITGLSGTPDNQDLPFIRLMRNLSPGAPMLLRLGGDSADWSWWKVPGMATPEAIRYTMTPAWGADVRALVHTLGAKTLLGVSLELNSRRIADYEVKEYEKYVGAKQIYGFEVGNEPELYDVFSFYHRPNGQGVLGRPTGYSMAQYAKEFSALTASMPGVPIVGPSSQSSTWLPQLGTMLSEMPKRLKLVTVHDYPLKHCSTTSHITESQLLAPSSIEGLADQIGAMVQAARAHGKPLRLDEINGITCGGEPGVSNSFGEALWALNVLPALWRAGVSGVNFQTISWNLNNMISATDGASGWNVTVEPEYYGLLTFADTAPAGSHLLTMSQPTVPYTYQYAVRAPDGADRVVLTNIGSRVRTIGVSAHGAHGTGTISLLTAHGLGALSGTTLAGQSLSSSTGELAGRPSYTLVKPNASGVYAVRIPAHSAAILTVAS